MDEKQTAVEWEQAGEIVVVKLPSVIRTLEQFRSLQEEFQRLIDNHHYDFILDFSNVRFMSSAFCGALVRLWKWARVEAEKLGKEYRPVAAHFSLAFKIFDNRDTAVKEMATHNGHGWVVLCSVRPEVGEVFKICGSTP